MASFSSLPTVTANLSLRLAASVGADIQTHWFGQRIGSPGNLAGPMSETDESFAFPSPPALGIGFAALAVGQTIVIDGEAMRIREISGQGETVTVTRNVAPLGVPPAAHEAGAPVYLLKYLDPWVMIADEALRPWAQQIVTNLGGNSATFGAQISGTLTVG